MKYYLQNVERGYVGNSLLWWRLNGAGYTCDLGEAQVFDGDSDKFKSLIRIDGKFRAWPVDYIDGIAERHVDMQNVNKELSVYGKPTPARGEGAGK